MGNGDGDDDGDGTGIGTRFGCALLERKSSVETVMDSVGGGDADEWSGSVGRNRARLIGLGENAASSFGWMSIAMSAWCGATVWSILTWDVRAMRRNRVCVGGRASRLLNARGLQTCLSL